MTLAVKELFYTLQGEGAQAGRPAVFLRFSGCNLWTGRERDRAGAVCAFCDTDFVGTDGEGGGRYTEEEVVARARTLWPGGGRPYLVCTGGEPALQITDSLVDRLHTAGFEVAVETNGTLPLPAALDWVCVSPKAAAPLAVRAGNELKLVYPQEAAPPERFETLAFDHFFLQPMDGPDAAPNTQAAIRYCLANPRWRLSVQTHKVIGIP